MEKADIQDAEDIVKLVDSFYEKVREDEILAPIFNEKIVDWVPHLHIMYKFWNSLLLGEESYIGQPLFKHVNLNIDADHFERWLKLFFQTVNENFDGPTAQLAKERAESIANVFYSRIQHIRKIKDTPL